MCTVEIGWICLEQANLKISSMGSFCFFYYVKWRLASRAECSESVVPCPDDTFQYPSQTLWNF